MLQLRLMWEMIDKMVKCSICHVNIRGNEMICPLCGNRLMNNEEKDIYPKVPLICQKHSLLFKVIILISVIVSIICLMINYILSKHISWAWFVLFGVLSNFIVLSNYLKQTNNIARLIFRQLTTIMFLSFVWDVLTGFHRFSLSFVLPIVSIFIMFNMWVIAKIKKLRPSDYLIYLIFTILLGIMPMVFIWLNVIKMVIPSYICIFCSWLSLSVLFIFKGGDMKREFIKFFHL